MARTVLPTPSGKESRRRIDRQGHGRPGALTAFLYLAEGGAIMVGVTLAGLAFAAPSAFAVNMLEARAYTLVLLGWLPGLRADRTWVGGVVLGAVLFVTGITLSLLGSFLMALPAL